MALFAVLGAWVAILELQVVIVPGLSLGPLTGDYAHNVIEVLAGLLCLGGAWQARREQTAWLLVGIGVLALALGNLYYTVVLYDMESPPIPSPADARLPRSSRCSRWPACSRWCAARTATSRRRCGPTARSPRWRSPR